MSKFYQELLASSLDTIFDLSRNLETLEETMSSSISELRNVITKTIKDINQELPYQFDSNRFMMQYFAQYPANDVNIQRLASELNNLRNTFDSLLQQREQISSLQYNIDFNTNLTQFFGSAAKELEPIKSELNSYECKDVDSYIEKSPQRDYSPIPNIYSHEFEKRLFPQNFTPIDSIFITRFLQRIRPNDTNSIVANSKRLINTTDEELYKLFEMQYESEYDMKMCEIMLKYPSYDIIMNHQLTKQIMKQVTSFESILGHDDINALLSKENMFKNTAVLYDMAASLDEFIEVSEEQTNSLPIITSKINAVDNNLRALKYMNNLLRKAQFIPIDKAMQHSLDYIHFQKETEDMFSDIIQNGFQSKHSSDIDVIIQRLGEFKAKLNEVKWQLERAVKDKEFTTQKLTNYTNPIPFDQSLLIATRERAFNMSKAVLDLINTGMQNRLNLKNEIIKCINAIATLETPTPYLEISKFEDTHDEDHIAWLKQIRDELKAQIAKLQEEIAVNESKIKDMPRFSNQSTAQVFIPASDDVYNELRTIVSCPLCEKEATHCIGKCGHIICGECVEKHLSEETIYCPICGVQITKSDIIVINW